jgi:hypothetical protein
MRHSLIRFRDAFSNFEENNSLTTYKGEVCTVARARALKAAETKRKKQEEKKARSRKKEIVLSAREMLEELVETCRSSKSGRMLKSIRAYARNGETQWGQFYVNFLERNRDVKKHLYAFVGIYDELCSLEKEMKRSLKKDVRLTLAIVDKFGYRLQDLIETVEKFGKAVSGSGVSDAPMWKTHEIYTGSTDGKRVGLRRIQQQMASTLKKMKSSVLDMARQSKEVYDDYQQKY